MSKHRLLVVRWTDNKTDRVTLKCVNCSNYVDLDHTSLYMILVEKSRLLIERTTPEDVERWTKCADPTTTVIPLSDAKKVSD